MHSNFMTLFLLTFCRSHGSHFSKMSFENFEKLKKEKFYLWDTKGEKIEKIRKIDFFQRNHTFSTWIWFLHVLNFLLRYITWVFLKIFKIFIFLGIDFPFMINFIPWPLATKIVIKYTKEIIIDQILPSSWQISSVF